MFSIRKIILLLSLALAAALAYIGAFLLRFEFTLPASVAGVFGIGLCIFVTAKIVMCWAFGLHENRWQLVGLVDLCQIALANFCASLLAVTMTAMYLGPTFPRSIYVIDAMLCFLATAGIQFSARLFREVLLSSRKRGKGKPILVYGAGAAGLQLAKELHSRRLGIDIVGFLDDDPGKQNTSLNGLPILGTGRDAVRLVTRFEKNQKPISEIIIAMPSANGRLMRTAIANCRAAGVPFKTLPSVSELLNGHISRQIREVSPNDLLGREPVYIDESRIGEAITGQSVLVTGGCGSIGSELCRQLAKFSPRKLVVFDQAESETFMLAMELRSRFPALDLVTEIGDIVRSSRVEEVMTRHGVEVVFHAAAYKHVPLMEANVPEAVENNVLGTYNVAQAACNHGVKKFVLISSDKAVNPTSIMGLTKRVAEIIVSAMPLDSPAAASGFVSVRFGNVLGSSGSVLPVFRRQIVDGGPVTITHPDMHRYFMSISEAVLLVLQASTMGEGSEVFVLDMGEPVAIIELARNMIRLAGLVPDEDIEIRVTGLRPGEKLFEELTLDDEEVQRTEHNKIRRLRSGRPNPNSVRRWLENLHVQLMEGNVDELVSHMTLLVPEYQGRFRHNAGREALQPAAAVQGFVEPAVLEATAL
jgi:FlaA1/EpsC-like NDP-sugar epimerase